MEQQNKNTEEKGVKIFHIENMLRNKYGLKPELSKILSKFIIDFSENLYESYDYEKVKRIRNAQSNLGLAPISVSLQTKISFYVGLMDKDDFSYKFSKHDAIEKIVEVVGDCTIQDAVGVFTRPDGKKIQTDTLVVTKILEEYDGNYIHYKAKELKRIFNQSSILTEENGRCTIEYNDESEEFEKEIEDLMHTYEWTWAVAKSAYGSGLF
jgi:hypothetical protein